tara:strand:- start:1398 stop:2345 length:948 start_codon:yes stop_codon:yes gene_type:complete
MMSVLVHDVPIIVLNWNGWDDSIICIESIYRAEKDAKVWLVDNNSDINRSDELIALFPMLRVIELAENFGWAVGNNKAIEIAITEKFQFVFLLNNDCSVDFNFLKSSLILMDDETAAIGSRIVTFDNQYVIFDGEYSGKSKKVVTSSNELINSKLVNGAGMLVNLSAFMSIGEFDKRYFCYDEESEWCERATQLANFEIKTNLASTIKHKREGSDIGENALYYRTRNKFIETSVRTPYIPYLIDTFLTKINEERKQGKEKKVKSLLCGLQDGLNKKFCYRTTLIPNYIVRSYAFLYRASLTRVILKIYFKLISKF